MKLSEVATFTNDVDGMADFYASLLASQPVARSEDMAIFLVGETKIFIHRSYIPAEGELPPEDHLAFTVGNVDAACERLSSAGLTIEVAPKDYYWGRSAYLRDPSGRLIELNQPG